MRKKRGGIVPASKIDPSSDHEVWRRRFEQSATLPLVWLLSAESLKRAADILKPIRDQDWAELVKDIPDQEAMERAIRAPLNNVYMMLVGLALENLLKGICLANDPNLIQDGKFKLAAHSLTALVAQACVALSPEESELMERLEMFVLSSGRYPIPLDYKDMMPRIHPAGGSGPMSFITGSDFDLINNLFDRLVGELQGLRNR